MRKMKIFIASLIAISGFSYLLISGFKESGIYYMKVGEVLNSPQVKSKKIKVEGDVVDGSIRKGKAIKFEITDGENKLKVVYSGVETPPRFKAGIPVILEGKYESEQKLFEAVKIITKCPSKYEAKEVKSDR